MEKDNVLYLMKSFQKELIRSFARNMDYVVNDNRNMNCPVTLTQIQIIEYVMEHHDEEIYQRDLEEVLNLRRATVSGVLQTMEKNGLVERVVHLQDARIKRILLNDSAKELFSYHKQRMQEMEQVMLKNISDDELETFSVVIKKIKDNIASYHINKE